MPSQPSPIFGTEQQADGENLNAWGQKLNAVNLQHEQIMGSILGLTVNADVTLTNTDYVENQSKRAGYILSGTGGFDVICPPDPRKYIVKNDCAATVTFTHNAGGTDIEVAAGEIKWIFTDGTDFFTAEEKDYLLLTGGTLTGDLTLAGAPTSALHAATKAYADLMLPLAGGTMTGDLILNGDATAALQAVTLQQLNATALGSVSVSFAWADITGKPTTISGYAITDAYTQTYIDANFQPLDATLTALSGVSTTADDFIYATGADTFSTVSSSSRGRNELARPSPREVDNTDSPVTAVFGDTIFVDCSSGAVEIDLPAATANSLPISIIDDDGSSATNNITIDPDGSETINGETSIEIDQARAAVTLIPFAGRWQIKK
jgi:hypothetical protein